MNDIVLLCNKNVSQTQAEFSTRTKSFQLRQHRGEEYVKFQSHCITLFTNILITFRVSIDGFVDE